MSDNAPGEDTSGWKLLYQRNQQRYQFNHDSKQGIVTEEAEFYKMHHAGYVRTALRDAQDNPISMSVVKDGRGHSWICSARSKRNREWWAALASGQALNHPSLGREDGPWIEPEAILMVSFINERDHLPEKTDEPMILERDGFANLTVTLDEPPQSVDDRDSLLTKLTLTVEGRSKSISVRHLQYGGTWKIGKTPLTRTFLNFMSEVDKTYYNLTRTLSSEDTCVKVMNCVAGCGRSGSAVLIALAPFLDTPLLASTGDSLLPPVPPPFDQDPYFKLLDTARECRSIIENKKQWMFVKEVGPKWAKRRVAL